MRRQVGPVSARFTGTMRMTDSTPPTGYTLHFEGQGGAAGFANGEAQGHAGAGRGRRRRALPYDVKAQVGGKLAQIGSRLIDGAAAKIADDFFARFSERLAPPAVRRRTVDETGEDRGGERGRAPRQPVVDPLGVARASSRRSRLPRGARRPLDSRPARDGCRYRAAPIVGDHDRVQRLAGRVDEPLLARLARLVAREQRIETLARALEHRVARRVQHEGDALAGHVLGDGAAQIVALEVGRRR